MRRRVHVLFASSLALAAWLLLGAQSSCSGSMPLKHAGEPCTRTSECEADLVCAGGVCRTASDGSASVD